MPATTVPAMISRTNPREKRFLPEMMKMPRAINSTGQNRGRKKHQKPHSITPKLLKPSVIPAMIKNKPQNIFLSFIFFTRKSAQNDGDAHQNNDNGPGIVPGKKGHELLHQEKQADKNGYQAYNQIPLPVA